MYLIKFLAIVFSLIVLNIGLFIMLVIGIVTNIVALFVGIFNAITDLVLANFEFYYKLVEDLKNKVK